MRRSGVLDRFRDQGDKTIPSGPPMRPNARASSADQNRMTGSSHTPGGQHHVHREKIGDHRGHGGSQHTGSRNTSVPPKVQGGRPQTFPPMRGGNDGPPDAA
jgi:hypothetical protein